MIHVCHIGLPNDMEGKKICSFNGGLMGCYLLLSDKKLHLPIFMATLLKGQDIFLQAH